MLYITLLDQFHPGIYSSQVIDVCDHLNSKHKVKIRVLAFLSIREIKESKPKIKALSPNSIVLPAFPGIRYFQFTSIFIFWVCLFTGERIAICRNVFSTIAALRVKRYGLLKKVIIDGRSAVKAEVLEYNVFPGDYFKINIHRLEGLAINNSDYRMAVSKKLVEYWRNNYSYTKDSHVIIPCTLNGRYFKPIISDASNNASRLRQEMGFKESDIILVYSGSTAPWQSFKLMNVLLTPILERDQRVKILFLSKENNDIKMLSQKYYGRIVVKWVNHEDIQIYLACGDYGVLIREQSDTNRVASPVKFAEYLHSGLKVLISENLGDFSEFVKENKCGYVVDLKNGSIPDLDKLNNEDRRQNTFLARKYFDKDSENITNSYSTLINAIKLTSI